MSDIMNQEQAQQQYDEVVGKINKIKKEWGYFAGVYKSKQTKAKRMKFLAKRFKKLDEQIFNECKDFVDELKSLMDESAKIWDKYGSYGILINYGKYGSLNPYEEFLFYYNRFKIENAGFGGETHESGFYTYDQYSFERGGCYFTHMLERMEKNARYLMRGHRIDGDLSDEDKNALPRNRVEEILQSIQELNIDYAYQNEKAYNDFDIKEMKESHKLRDYEHQKNKILRYCRQNNITIKK